MAELTKVLHFLKSGTEQTAKAYSTVDEVGDNYVKGKIDSVACYIPIGSTDDAMATNGRVIKGGTTYAIKSQAKPPYAKVEYTTPGTYTFTVPQGITTLRCEIAGAGGGGGGGGGGIGTFIGGGGGGSGYKVFGELIVVEPNSTITVVVGAGGAGGARSSYKSGDTGSAGGDSKVANIVGAGGAGGGGGGRADDDGAGGVGGNAGNKGTTAGTTSGVGAGGAGGAGGELGVDDGAGGAGGGGGASSVIADKRTDGSSGSDGWVVIEYGGDI